MDAKTIIRNIRTKGLIKTARIAFKNINYSPEYFRWKSSGKSLAKKYDKLVKAGDEDAAKTFAAEEFEKMADAGVHIIEKSRSEAEKKDVSRILKEQEDLFKKKYPKEFRKYHKKIAEKTIKIDIPAIYAEESKKPVENKVIFMESGGSPSPTGYHLSKEIKRQGKYEVSYRGLQIRKVADAEYYYNAREYIKDLATAKAVFMSTANDFLSQFDVRPETKVIQLWHGVGAFKKVGYSTIESANFGRSEKKREEYDQYRNYTHVTIAGEGQLWVFEDAFRISRESGILRPIGIARTDVFYWENYYQEQMDKLLEKFPQCKGKKIVLYAPTFRGKISKAKAPDQLDIRLLAERLPDDYILLIKHHGLSQDRPPIPADLENVFAFDMNENSIISIEGLLRIADILITDYSSVGFEFAIREKPLIFFAYDLDDYLDQRGMYFDYEDITPGPVCKTTEEIADYICNIEERFDVEEVRAFKKKYVDACDGHAIERTIALLEE